MNYNFQTPEIVADYMVTLIPKKCRTILEPTPGKGNLVNALEKSDRPFEITALTNFWDLDDEFYDCVLMNPPFNKDAFFDHSGKPAGYNMPCSFIIDTCMKRTDNIIALLPWSHITNSVLRVKQLMNYGLQTVITLPRKTFPGSRVQTCIVQLKKGYPEKTEFKYFDW